MTSAKVIDGATLLGKIEDLTGYTNVYLKVVGLSHVKEMRPNRRDKISTRFWRVICTCPRGVKGKPCGREAVMRSANIGTSDRCRLCQAAKRKREREEEGTK